MQKGWVRERERETKENTEKSKMYPRHDNTQSEQVWVNQASMNKLNLMAC